MSSRRAVGALREHRRVLGLRRVPHFITLTRRARDASLPRLIETLVELLRREFRPREALASVDSTGIATTHGKRWIGEKRKPGNDWRKLYTLQDVETGFIIAAETSNAREHDSVPFPALVGSIYAGTKVLADRAYLGHENLFLIEDAGGEAFIRVKANTRIHRYSRDRLSRLARRAKTRPWWLVYRNSHESRFSMLKRVVKPILRWKSDRGRDNELLFAVVVHDIRIVEKWAL
ncbi:MAG: transposase [Thermoplasmatota archaeon]